MRPSTATTDIAGLQPGRRGGRLRRRAGVGSTASITTPLATGCPTNPSHTAKHRNASTKCVAGPARITSERCQIGLAPKVLGRSSGATVSYGFIPAIFT